MTTAIIQLFTAGIGAAGFGLFSNINNKYIPVSALGGALGWAVYLIAKHGTISLFLPMLIAGFSAAIYAEVLARICHAPSTPFFITTAIPLVPGSSLYYCMSAFAEGNVIEAGQYGWQTIVYSLAIASGMSIAWCICDFIRKIRKKIWTGES